MNSKHTPASLVNFQLNPNAKEFVPASSRSSAGGSAPARRQKPLVIKDKESDKAFHQRLNESRDFWDLKKVPSYKKLKCAACKLEEPHNTQMLKEVTHDVVNLVAYYHDCQDKDKEYECKYCVDKFDGVVDPDDERYACNDSECCCEDCEKARCDYSSDEDYSFDDEEVDDKEDHNKDPDERRKRMKLERKRAKAYKKRNQREHIEHLNREHERKLKIVLYFKQDFIPLCEGGFYHGEFGLDEVLRCLDLNKGRKFLHMVEPPRPRSPGSPNAWQYMMGMEDDDYDMYNYENEWQSPRKEGLKEMLRKALCRMDSDIDDDEVIENTRRLYDMFDSSDSDY